MKDLSLDFERLFRIKMWKIYYSNRLKEKQKKDIIINWITDLWILYKL